MPQVSPSFVLLLQEGAIVHAELTAGLTALRRCNDTRAGACYEAFFHLSIGLERLLKLIVILQHMAGNGLVPPTRQRLKAYGHNLNELLASVRTGALALGREFVAPAPAGTVTGDIVALLSDFAQTARYHNLDALVSKQEITNPLRKWRAILDRILREEASATQVQHILRRFGPAAFALERTSIGELLGLDGGFVAGGAIALDVGLDDLACGYAVQRILKLLAALREALEHATAAAKMAELGQGVEASSIPDMPEFLKFVPLVFQRIREKRRWP